MNIETYLNQLGENSVIASNKIKSLTLDEKNALLESISKSIIEDRSDIIKANDKDVSEAQEKLSKSMIDRLQLNEERIDGIIQSIETVISLPDPIGNILFTNTRPNGMKVERVSVPLGVVGIIYESRPNVTVDASILCLKSGNSVILRGGSESFNSNLQLVKSMQKACSNIGLDKNIIQFIETTDRSAVDYMLSKMSDYIDVVVPRGGKGLVKKVQESAKIPVIGHLDGICHIYVDESSDPSTASKIVTNAKLRRTSICGAAETVLIDEKCLDSHLPKIINDLKSGGCEIRGDERCKEKFNEVILASDDDWKTEYLDAIISIRVVNGVEDAIDHIEKYGSGHTESIVSENKDNVEQFLNSVGSAIVMHNASTQFADGGEFGLGAEIGIATGKLHARGPVGLEGLTTYKYIVRGNGQIRP
jgi:glutamate-5-semialdehyde dehydrogenase